MTRVELGSKWKEAPLIVRLLRVPPSSDAECPDYPERQRQVDHDWILQPPALRGYGYMTRSSDLELNDGVEVEPFDDFKSLGYDPQADRQHDLKRWAHDLDLAVEAGLITQHEGEAAWASATKNQPSSTSSTGTSSTNGSPTTTRSSKDSPTVVAGRPLQARRKQGNRRSSLPSRWKPPGAA